MTPSRLGRYLLLEQLHTGGFAEVFLARTLGLPGLEQLVALKRIHPRVAADEDFRTSFLDEARVGAQLRHGNLVQVLEVGQEAGTYFIAMEYISGRSLRALLEHLVSRGESVPIAQAAWLAARICEGLDFAHRKTDVSGEPLGIVHRALSPDNVLLSWEGAVKVIDFGLAKAANRVQQTQVGTIRGQMGYLSPEQVRGQPVDRRADLFALGVVLFEMLTGMRLFSAKSEADVVQMVADAQVPPPRSLNPAVPEALELVVLKALAREPEERFQWASELMLALQPFATAEGAAWSAALQAAFLQETFGEGARAESARLQRLATLPAPPARTPTPARELLPFDTEEEADEEPEERTVLVRAEAPPGLPPPEERTVIVRAELPDTPPASPRRPAAAGGTRGSGSHPGLAAKGTRGSGSQPSVRLEGQRRTLTSPALRPRPGSNPELKKPLPPPASLGGAIPQEEEAEEATHLDLGRAPRPVPASPASPLAPEAPARSAARRRPLVLAAAAGLLVLLGAGALLLRGPAGSSIRVQVSPAEKALVTIGGRLVENGRSTVLPPGEYDLVAMAPGYKKHTQRIRIFEGEPEALVTLLLEHDEAAPAPTPPPAAPAPTTAAAQPGAPGHFTARFISVQPGVDIRVEGKSIGRTPEASIHLPIGSAYRYEARAEGFAPAEGVFGSSGEAEVTVTVALDPEEKASAKRPAAPRGSGQLVCSSEPEGADIYINGKPSGRRTPVLATDPLVLPVGRHRVLFEIAGMVSAVKTVEVKKGRTVTLSRVPIDREREL